MADDRSPIVVTVNGERRALHAEPSKTLLRALREDLGLTGAKEGCGQGDCGTCVVILDGLPVNACLVLSAEVDGAEVTTPEGLADGAAEHPLQRRFRELWGFQCGYCTPGMLMSSYALLQQDPDPDEEAVREGIEGNLCRCTNYRAIVDAVRSAAADVREVPGG